ncbi:ERG2 and Sigma1 receptor like protein-domain-containing protein [Mycena haematopus]|nr:ERG2 and Sigma1 receptor like protein-domain-containing protein [Mycena haematopus]
MTPHREVGCRVEQGQSATACHFKTRKTRFGRVKARAAETKQPADLVTVWGFRLILGVLFIAVCAWLDTIKHRWYVFDPTQLHELAQAAIASSPNDTAGMIQHIVTNLTLTYPEWTFSNSGGAMGAMYIIHASITEYLIIFGTPLGTEGHTGLHTADDYFNILVGEQWAFLPGWIPLMLPFGLADTFTSTLDPITMYHTFRIAGREMIRNIFIGKI